MKKVKNLVLIAGLLLSGSMIVTTMTLMKKHDPMIETNIEALTDDEYGLDIPQWTRTHFTAGGYNCYKPGSETC